MRFLTFVVHLAGQEIARLPANLDRPVTVGRREGAYISSDDPAMSTAHAEIFPAPGGALRIRDCGSRNGTFVNGERIVEAELRPGDEVEIGLTTISLVRAPVYEMAAEAGPRPLARGGSGRGPVLASEAARAAGRREGPREEPPRDGQEAVTAKITIDIEQLRTLRPPGAVEEARLLLLRDLSEALRGADRRARLFAATRRALRDAFTPGRFLLLLPTAENEFRDPVEPTPERPPSDSIALEAATRRHAVLVTDALSDARFADAESVIGGQLRSAMVAPLLAGGRVVALLYADRTGGRPFQEADLRFMGIAANHASTALENVDLLADLGRANKDLSAARDALAELNRDLERRVDERTAEVRRQAEEIGRLASEKDELIGIAAHDIRGPLTVILGLIDLILLDEAELPRRAAEHLGKARGAVDGLGTLLSDLLDVKAIEKGKIRLELEECTLGEVIVEADPIASLAAATRGVRVEYEADLGERLRADRKRLGQVFVNLLVNAIRFSSQGGAVLVSARPEGAGLVVVVADEGGGIAPEELARLFGPFVQGEEGKRRGGSGLGLAIARKLVELHGGWIRAESEPGKGARFTFWVPRTGGGEGGAAEAPSEPAAQAPLEGGGAAPP